MPDPATSDATTAFLDHLLMWRFAVTANSPNRVTNKSACTCDPEAYDVGPEGQRRYFEDRYCPLHGEEAQDANGATRRRVTRDDLLTFINAFRRAVETEHIDGSEPPLWLRNGYDDARELCGLTPDIWPAPWERTANDAD